MQTKEMATYHKFYYIFFCKYTLYIFWMFSEIIYCLYELMSVFFFNSLNLLCNIVNNIMSFIIYIETSNIELFSYKFKINVKNICFFVFSLL